jgi:hypothetical protein
MRCLFIQATRAFIQLKLILNQPNLVFLIIFTAGLVMQTFIGLCAVVVAVVVAVYWETLSRTYVISGIARNATSFGYQGCRHIPGKSRYALESGHMDEDDHLTTVFATWW